MEARANANNPMAAVETASQMADKFKSMGLMPAPVDAKTAYQTEELRARMALAQMNIAKEERAQVREEQFKQAKEAQSKATEDRIVDLAQRAIQTIGDPISKAVGQSIMNRSLQPPAPVVAQASGVTGQVQVVGPPQPQQPQPGQPGEATPEMLAQQDQKLADLIARATQARAETQARMKAMQDEQERRVRGQ